ncbi:uncharacterized protein FFB20_04345 [Fusarium fujikuroi]|uniref:SNF2 N-terminal domain-containing protein n=1 Tax=Gibberella fujikuroi (strain CBS 195.34 / IMI 58289 / NRRL A-6831) TaxID=1279085 RepID=S0DMT5_GIBF5|nr:uncharacterized protein FFUJ_00741 [Fusarium fujikuroi IMI 58289]KLP03061.1 uncharacterized protein Y057_9864 [Fusarium fujikuroi]KLP13698.1 uncharacterized protein LW94_5705 [Fusarium fujikuroi]QGI59154.1 hypothetical protein CEK27_001279 [Fusarium fujikuroi]QGI90064.1 hypothetical protein CEK26_001279 [Fusarium fujikuroi]CCT62682.1 uncharacterized protein FFUJ_00741 [Fusarium fujikuroi IMI 58289]
MAYNNTSHGSLHALFEASFQKLTDAVSSDTSTVSHKAHCDRNEQHLLSGLSIIGAGDEPADAEFIQHNRPPKYLGNTDFHSYLDIFDELNTELKHWQTARAGKLALVVAVQVKRAMPTRSGFNAIVTRVGCVLQWVDEIKRHCKPSIGLRGSLDDPKIDTSRLLDYGIVIFLKRRYQESLTFEGNVERPNAVLHSNYYSQVNRNITVLILDESHDYRNEQSLYFDAVKSLKYHHLFMLSGTPMFSRSEDIMRQSRLMPGGGLFSSKEHYKALFYSDAQQQHPTGPPLQLFNRLYRGLMVA